MPGFETLFLIYSQTTTYCYNELTFLVFQVTPSSCCQRASYTRPRSGPGFHTTASPTSPCRLSGWGALRKLLLLTGAPSSSSQPEADRKGSQWRDRSGAAQAADCNHDLPGAGWAQQDHVNIWRPFMDVSLCDQGQPSAMDGASVHLCGPSPGPTAPCSHHQLWKIAGSQGYITQWDLGTSGAVFGNPICAGPNRRTEIPTAWATNVLAGHQECYSVCSGLPSVPGGPLFAQWYAPCVVHGQLGYSGNLRAGAERGLPLPEHLCTHRGR